MAERKPLEEWLVPHKSHQMTDWAFKDNNYKIQYKYCLGCGGTEMIHPQRGYGITDDLLKPCPKKETSGENP